jgi:secreted PhoX family phosphatase
MKRKALLLIACVFGLFSAQAQIKFDPKIDVNFVTDTVMVPGKPLKYQILFIGGYDMVQSTATYGNPAGKTVSKSWNDFIGFTPDTTGESLGWVSINHERVVANDQLGDGGGMTVFRVKRDPNSDTLIVMEQTLKDGRKGDFFNVDFVNYTGETGMNCGGIISLADGRIWTAEEWMRYSNRDIADRDTSDFIIGQGTVKGQAATAGFPGFNGEKIKKYQNYNYMTEIDPREAVAVRKQYNWGRQAFEGGVIMEDNKTAYLGVDNTPGFFSKFVADVPGDFTKGTTYVYRHDDQQLRLNHFSSKLNAYAEISAYDEVNNRIYSTNSENEGVNVYSFIDGMVDSIGFIDLSSYGEAPTSVTANNGVLAVAIPGTSVAANGVVVFYDKDYAKLKEVTVGVLPDMVTFTPDGKYVITANEAEPSDDYKTDPEGSVSIIDVSNGVANATVSNATFNGVSIPADVRIFGQHENTATDLFFSEYAEGSSNNKYLEIYNGTGAEVDLSTYAFPNVGNAPTTVGEYEFWNTFPANAKIADGETYIIAHPSADASILAKANHTFTFLSNGDDGFCLVKGGTWNDGDNDGRIDAGEMTGFTKLDCIGDWNGDPGSGWDVAGVTEATKDHTLVRKGSANGNADWTSAAGTTTENSEWIVKNNEDWTNLGMHDFNVMHTPEQDMEPEYVAVSTDSKTAYVACQENNAIAVVDIATAKITKVIALGFKDYSLAKNAIDASDKDDSIGNFNAYANVFGMYQPDAITVVEIGGKDYILTANEGDARDYDGFSEEVRVDDLTLDPTAFPNAAELQKEENLGRLKTTTTLGDIDGDGDYDQIYSYGARSFTIWDTDGNIVFDSENEFGRVLAENYPNNYASSRDDDKASEPESITTATIDGKVFAFIGLERATGVMVYDITDPAKATFVQYYNKNENDLSPEGLLVVDSKQSTNGTAYLISTNEAFGSYGGSVSAYSITGFDGKKWVEINNTDINKMLNYHHEAVNVGATMFNRLEWVTYDKETKAVYLTETGRDNPGGRWADENAKGAVHAAHTIARANDQGTTPNSGDYWDYYGRVLKYDPATEDVTVQIEGGPYSAHSPSISQYPENHLSNPDGLSNITIHGRPYLVICEDLNGTSNGRVPAGISNRACELYLLDLTIANPTTKDLIRVNVGPVGAEITGACPTPDGKTLLVNSQHPSSTNPFPYNYSLTYALTGWDLDKLVSAHNLQKKNDAFVIYPNPTSGIINLDKVQDVAIYGNDGRLINVYEQVKQVDLSNNAQGIYYIRNAEGATKRVILN